MSREMQSCDYKGIVGCLNYLALTIRPDIAHAANLLGSFVYDLGKRHWNAAKEMIFGKSEETGVDKVSRPRLGRHHRQ